WLSEQEKNMNQPTPQVTNVLQQEPLNSQDDSVFNILSNNDVNTQPKLDPLSAFEDDDLDF
ncbi:MAG TPA: hypothetical protein QF644_01525, partial [Candidatus Poseidoniaceae archaeon]|nr:hypothetical protein [Candidatus Poseidoniaceae archaeon]